MAGRRACGRQLQTAEGMVLWVGLVGMALLSLAVAIESVTTVGIFGADLVLQGSVNSGFIRLLERILPANSTKVVSRAVAGHEPTVADLNDFIGLERPNILVLSMDSHMDMKNGASSDAIAESIEQFVVAGLLSEPPPKLFITGPIHLEECESENDVNFDYMNAQLENLALQYKISFIHFSIRMAHLTLPVNSAFFPVTFVYIAVGPTINTKVMKRTVFPVTIVNVTCGVSF